MNEQLEEFAREYTYRDQAGETSTALFVTADAVQVYLQIHGLEGQVVSRKRGSGDQWEEAAGAGA